MDIVRPEPLAEHPRREVSPVILFSPAQSGGVWVIRETSESASVTSVKGRAMFGYVRGCFEAIGRGLQDGVQKAPGAYHGTTAQVALFNAASDTLRILIYGTRRS